MVLWEFLFLLPVLLLLPAVLRLPFAPERLESPCSSAPERGPFPVPLEVLADVWDLGDVGIGLMTIFNMIALIPLSGQAIESLKDYERNAK